MRADGTDAQPRASAFIGGFKLRRLPRALDSHHVRLSAPDPEVYGDGPLDISLTRNVGRIVSSGGTWGCLLWDREASLRGERCLLLALIVKAGPGDFQRPRRSQAVLLRQIFKDELPVSHGKKIQGKHLGKKGPADFVPSLDKAIHQVFFSDRIADLPGLDNGANLLIRESHHLFGRPEFIVRKTIDEGRIGKFGIPLFRIKNFGFESPNRAIVRIPGKGPMRHPKAQAGYLL